MKNFDEVIERARQRGVKKVAVAGGEDSEAILALEEARKKGIASGIFVGEPERIRQIADSHNIDPGSIEILEALGTIDSSYAAIDLIKSDKAQILMKGKVKTAEIMKAVLDKERGIPTGRLLSHVLVNFIKKFNRFLIVSDGGVVIKPGLKEKIDIMFNAIQVASALEIKKPAVAILSVSGELTELASSADAAQLAMMARRGQLKFSAPAVVEGPLDIDTALFNFPSENGKTSADILIVPDLDTGNVLGKSIMFFVEALCGLLIMGAQAPIVLTSRASDSQTKLNSIALAAIME